MTAVRSIRNPMAPTAAPQPSPPHIPHQYGPFPSPHSAGGYEMSPVPQPYASPVSNCFINPAYYDQFRRRTLHDAQNAQRPEEKRSVVEAHFGWFQSQILDELRRLKIEVLQSQGLPTGKRKSDGDEFASSLHGSPKMQKLKQSDDDEDEVNPKGTWRCLYYEEDPEANFHCKDKRYKRVSELRRHIKTHTLPHYCDKCGYRTAEERRLHHHKCEPANRKKYSPVTEEDRLKHEQLARMGIKVGQMRMILFGKKSDNEDMANGDDVIDETESSGDSGRPSMDFQAQEQQQPAPQRPIPNHGGYYVPTTVPGVPYHAADFSLAQNPMRITTPPHQQGPFPVSQSPVQMLPAQVGIKQEGMQPVPPPLPGMFQPASPIQSPPMATGHAAWYYHGHHQQETGDFVLYPPVTYAGASPANLASDGTNSSPPMSNHNNQSPSGQYQVVYTSAEQQISPVARTDSLNTFLNDVFPEVGESDGCRNREIPKEEIEEMERNMRAMERNGTESTKVSSRSSVLVKLNFFRSLSMRSSDRKKDSSVWRRLSAPLPSRFKRESTLEQHPENPEQLTEEPAPIAEPASKPAEGTAKPATTPAENATSSEGTKDPAPTQPTPEAATSAQTAEHGGIVGTVKKVFRIGIGRRRPTA